MLIGIDVGGTYTDGVALSESGEIINLAKYPTHIDRLLDSLSGCLDALLSGIDPREIERVSISTTLLTNAIVQLKVDKVGLVVLPGPGICPEELKFGTAAEIISGAIDFRGRETIPIDFSQLARAIEKIRSDGCQSVAVTGKFAQRNNLHEITVEKYIKERFPALEVELGHRINGSLNFPRRAATTYLTAATKRLYNTFLADIKAKLNEKGIHAPLHILKADGGSQPVGQEQPVETIYSGPAASVLGVLALSEPVETIAVMDIGGTTTDLGLVLSGKPLLSSRGAEIGNFRTQVRSFAVNSAPVGGDTPVAVDSGCIKLGLQRLGPAYCLGGPVPTVTDALNYLGLSAYGSAERAREAIGKIAKAVDSKPEEVARLILQEAVGRICQTFKRMLASWEKEPAYRVWQVLNPQRIDKLKIIGVGGAAAGLTPLVAEKLQVPWHVPEAGKVANALGAALAIPTFKSSLWADTALGVYTLSGDSARYSWPGGGIETARTLVSRNFNRLAGKYNGSGQITREEVFNVVRDRTTLGKIIEIDLELEPGVITHVGGNSDG